MACLLPAHLLTRLVHSCRLPQLRTVLSRMAHLFLLIHLLQEMMFDEELANAMGIPSNQVPARLLLLWPLLGGDQHSRGVAVAQWHAAARDHPRSQLCTWVLARLCNILISRATLRGTAPQHHTRLSLCRCRWC